MCVKIGLCEAQWAQVEFQTSRLNLFTAQVFLLLFISLKLHQLLFLPPKFSTLFSFCSLYISIM